jgi:hypothetical protein
MDDQGISKGGTVRSRRRARGEEGVTLILAMTFMLLFGLVVAAVLTQVSTGLKTTPVVSDKDQKLYAADAGIDFGINAVRDEELLCPDTAAGTQDVGDVTINGRAVHVTCQTVAGDNGQGGSVFGPSGWTIVATGWGSPSWAHLKAGDCDKTALPDPSLGSTIQVFPCPGSTATPRTVNDATVTANSDLVNSASANFVASDKGATISGNGIPASTTIKAIKSATQVQLSKRATISGTNVAVTIGGKQTVTYGGTKVFNAGGFKLPASVTAEVEGSIIQYEDNGYCTRDKTAANYPTPNDANPIVGKTWQCVQPGAVAVPDPKPNIVVPTVTPFTVTGTLTSGQKPVTLTSGTVSSSDVGSTVTGVGIPNDTKIQTVTDATHFSLSRNATVSGPQTLTITPVGHIEKKTGTCPGHTINYVYPGVYNGVKPEWGGYTYFASGVYYIIDTGETAISGTALVGGEPAPTDTRFVPLPAGCESAFTDAAANTACGGCLPVDPGKGVTIIIGGTTLLDIHGGTTELFSRVPGTQDAGATPYTAIVAIADAAARDAQMSPAGAYKLLSNSGQDRCNCSFVTDQSLQQIIFHGMTYSPYSPVDVYNNAGIDYSPFYGGVVASWIIARVDSGSQSGLFAGQFNALGGPSKRTVIITATAPGTEAGQTSAVSTAVIEIDVDADNTVTVQSWRNE